MRSKLKIAAGVVVILAAWLFYVRWSSAITQPQGFSHSQHVKQKIECSTCHKPDKFQELPAGAQCRSCHTTQAIPDEIVWVRVYRVAPDIIFSHTNHTQTPCSTCHEAFTSAKRWIHESRFKMSFCMDCHAEASAPNQCRDCHKNR